MAVVLDGTALTVEKLVRIARHGEKVELPPEALERIRVCRGMLEEKIEAREVMYGVNTGIGELCEVILNDEQIREFQKYLIYNHAAGIGDPVPIEYVRGAMASRVNVHAHGKSGCRPEITVTLVEMLNRGVTPVVCQKGSVGACGDLAPMSQIALLMMGEGEAFFEGERMPGRVALERAGIPVPGLMARDGLATINGSNLLTAMSAIQLYDMDRWLRQAEIACAMTLEALLANMKPYDVRLHEARGFPGAVRSARAIMKCIEGSELLTAGRKTKVQDAYSMRSSPQVIGAAHDAIAYATSQVEIELNGVGFGVPGAEFTVADPNAHVVRFTGAGNMEFNAVGGNAKTFIREGLATATACRVVFVPLIGEHGYGKDASLGRGCFRVTVAEAGARLFESGGNRLMSLSHGSLTWNMHEPRYRLETHYGKLGGGRAVTGKLVGGETVLAPFKYPLSLLKPGATFAPGGEDPFGELLHGVHNLYDDVVHNAWHLTVPYTEVKDD